MRARQGADLPPVSRRVRSWGSLEPKRGFGGSHSMSRAPLLYFLLGFHEGQARCGFASCAKTTKGQGGLSSPRGGSRAPTA